MESGILLTLITYVYNAILVPLVIITSDNVLLSRFY